ncbi:MAG: HDOD domain-containing protein, partial [Candidatus Glassbacteria bacterium]
SIRQVVTEVLRIIKDEKSSAKDLKDITAQDPPLCARLLKLANSAYYGYPRTISDIQEAIVCIGFEAIRDLALTQKVCELFMDDEVRHGYSRRQLWRHCSAVALFCKMFYRREFRERGDDIYAAGLLHDIGIIVEDQIFPEVFGNILEESVRNKRNLSDVEKEMLRINHLEIGKAIAQSWSFPDELIQALAFHEKPDLADENCFKFVATVYLANFICQRQKIGYIGTPNQDLPQYHSVLARLGIKEKAVEIITEEVMTELWKLEEIGWFSK